MKRLTLVLLTAALPLPAFAQGKLTLMNDSASLVMFTTDTSERLPPDLGLAGQPVGNAAVLPSGITFMAGLYGGTSSSQLFLYSTVALTDPNTPAGRIPATHIVLNANAATGAPAIPGIADGTAIGAATPWFQVRIWDAAYASFNSA